MKRVTTLVVVVGLNVAGLPAQDNLFVGAWKLNLEKSTFTPGPPPQNQTTIIETVGKGTRHTTTGIAADGSTISYTYVSNFDGKYEPIAGAGRNGADAVAAERVSPNTIEATYKKGGKVVQMSRTLVSKDGKLRTVTSKGTNAKGQATNTVTVYDRR